MARMPSLVPTEKQEHLAFMDWVRMQPNALIRAAIIHIPNQANHDARYGRVLKQMGLRAGVSDFFLPIPRNNYSGLWLELKRVSGGRENISQKNWIDLMRSLAYRAEFAYGAEHAINLVKEYMHG